MYPLFYTFMTLGLRAGEIRGLIWDNYDPVEQSLEIEKQGSRYANEERVELKSEASSRILYLGSGMVNALNIQFRWQLKMSSGNESWNPLNLIFCNKQGGMFHETALHKAAISRQKRAGVRSFHLHDQRDFALSRLVAEGYDAATVSKIAGHSKVATTYDTYVRAFEDRQRQVRLSFPTTAPTKNARTPTNTTEALNPKNDYNE
jgi:integrase